MMPVSALTKAIRLPFAGSATTKARARTRMLIPSVFWSGMEYPIMPSSAAGPVIS